MIIALSIVAGLELAAVVTLGILLGVSRRSLRKARRSLARARRGETRPSSRGPAGLAPMAVKMLVGTAHTADAIVRRSLGVSVRSSIEDLAGWARVERPNLGRIVTDGRVVLVFSDIEGSTERNRTLGDQEWVRLLERHDELLRTTVRENHGAIVKNQGDGFMIAFAQPAQALSFAVSVQRALAADPDRWDWIRVRMGAHVGTSVRRGDDLFGLDVAIAARVAAAATGGEILVSEPLRDAVAGDDGFAFDEAREVEMKGLAGPQAVSAVQV